MGSEGYIRSFIKSFNEHNQTHPLYDMWSDVVYLESLLYKRKTSRQAGANHDTFPKFSFGMQLYSLESLKDIKLFWEDNLDLYLNIFDSCWAA